MNQLQMLKRALIAYVNSMKIIWSAIAHPLSIVSKRKGALKDYRIYGNSIQGGTPTSEAPIEIQSVGELITEGEYEGKYKIPIIVRGKNYFDLDKIPFNTSTTQPYNNGLKATKIASMNGTSRIPIYLPVGKTIYITMDVVASQIEGTSDRIGIRFYNSENTMVKSFQLTSSIAHKSYSFTLSEDISYIQFYFQANNSSNAVGDYVTMDNIMLRCEGDDTFEPYIEPQNFDIYFDEPLRKAGDYADCIDFENQKVVRNIKQEIITEIDVMSGDKTTYVKFTPQISEKPLINGKGTLGTGMAISNKFKSINVSYRYLGDYGGVIMPYITSSNKNTVALTFNDTSINTITEAQAAIGDGFDVCYILAEPTEEDIELPKLPQFKGTTIYEVDTTIKPSGMEVCYYE